MLLGRLRAVARNFNDPTRRQALADAYAPIVRGFLLPCAAYYVFVTWGHWRDEAGSDLLILAGISIATVLVTIALRQWFLSGETVSFGRLELAGLTANMLIYANVVAYLLLHFEESKLIYFPLMAVVFSTSSVTSRTMLFSVGLAIGTLIWFSTQISPAALEQHMFIGVATAFAALGMAFLLRKAMSRQVDARLRADMLAERAGQLADTDMLTDLPNRRAIFDTLERHVRDQRPCWLCLLDLDGFKAINDAYSHSFGDNLLLAVTERCSRVVGESTRFGRIGGDEFALIYDGRLSEDDVAERVRKVIAVISKPYTIAHTNVYVGATAGLCHYPAMAQSADAIYERADFALYGAKANLRGDVCFFDTIHKEEMESKATMERSLREGDLETELHVLFQPQYSLKQTRIVGFEALARWQSPVLGLVRPDIFIRAAERSGHMSRITPILFRKALAEAKNWPGDISLAFNLSTCDLADPALIAVLLAEISKANVAPGRVEFEITETAVMQDLPMARTLLNELSAAGCRIALDDFGSGYSSFGYIDELPLDKVKIDQSFVHKVSTRNASREIVAGILSLCQKLELDCVLEGVETQSQLDLLDGLGGDIIQGFIFGKPMPAHAVMRLLTPITSDAAASL